MDDPVKEIPPIISLLTTTTPSIQLATINKYFLPSAQFTHPFCRTPPSPTSRWHLSRIYRWYKIMSPRISIRVESVGATETATLYVGIRQIFGIWAVPFHEADVRLVTSFDPSLACARGEGKWYIASQEDLYQTDQFMRFLVPQLAWLVVVWQVLATWGCVVLSYLFEPVTWWEEERQREFGRGALGDGDEGRGGGRKRR
ncbi:hypothetical protein BDZ85DRAFT_233474 [Elsinoe ampelina]|uniref:SigF-like NTF2-like domain-containing protein n=1 Tax=Elsinoe ampelina TaxID=302913 RepID=A0A6A6GHH8_9PEZI|nr:hypothetical protein BDZ85DRAFT_233474 [Elsinoe ampelina]